MDVPVLANGSEAAELSRRLGLKLIDQPVPSYFLVFSDGVWGLKHGDFGKNFYLYIDLGKELDQLQSQKISLKKDLLCRAVGFTGQEQYHVFDASLGFAKDALHLLSFGMRVTGCEKHPIVSLLIENAMARAPELADRFVALQGESSQKLAGVPDPVDCIFFDPMYEDVKKKSAPKKNLAFLRSINTADAEPQKIVQNLWQSSVKRLVVKRPINGEHLLGPAKFGLTGKIVRYDVYTR